LCYKYDKLHRFRRWEEIFRCRLGSKYLRNVFKKVRVKRRKAKVVFGFKSSNIRFKLVNFGKVRFVNWLFKQHMLMEGLY